MIKAFLFDLGNTLVRIPEEYDEEMCLARRLGLNDMDSVRSHIYSLCNRYIGQSTDEFLTRFCHEVNPTGDTLLNRDIYQIWQQSVESAHLTEGALELLDRIRSIGVRLALVSNTPPTSHAIIDRMRLRQRFDAVVFSCDVGYLKPDPRIFRVALDQLGIAPEECVVIGDKIRTDILGGAILGTRTILLERRLRLSIENDQNYVDAVICSLKDLYATRIWNSISGSHEPH